MSKRTHVIGTLYAPRDMKPRLVKLPPMRTKSASIEQTGLSAMPGSRGTLLMKPQGWGAMNEGRWFQAHEATSAGTEVGGTCFRCGQTARAIDLKLTLRKDGSTVWTHKDVEECR